MTSVNTLTAMSGCHLFGVIGFRCCRFSGRFGTGETYAGEYDMTSGLPAIVAFVAVSAIVLGVVLGVAEIRRHGVDPAETGESAMLPRSSRFSAAMLLVGMGTLVLGILLMW